MIKKTSSWLLVALTFVLVIVSGVIVGARLALPKVAEFNVQISSYLSETLDANLEIAKIHASWREVNPRFQISDIAVQDKAIASRKIYIREIKGQLDVLQSIVNFAPIFAQLSIDGMQIDTEQIDGRWLTVLSPASSDKRKPVSSAAQTSQKALNKYLAIVARQSKVTFSDASITLKPQNLPVRTLGPIQLLMENTTQMHQLSGSAQLKNYGDQSAVSFALQAPELDEDIVQTPYQLYAKFENITEQFLNFNLINVGLDIERMAFDADVWATLKNGVISDVVGNLAVDSLILGNPKTFQLMDSKLRFQAVREAEKQHFLLSDIELFDGQHRLDIAGASATYNFDSGFIQQLGLEVLDFTKLKAIYSTSSLLSPAVKAELEKINLQGELHNLRVNWRNKKLSSFDLLADLHQVSVNSYKGAPALSGVSGLLQLDALSGSVDLNTDQLSMSFPKLFEVPWHYAQSTGRVSWKLHKKQGKIDKVTVNSELLSLKGLGENEQFNGRFSLMLPLDRALQSELILMIGAQQSKLKDVLGYLPKHVVNNALRDWVKQAAARGKVTQSLVVIRTGLSAQAEGSFNPSVQLDFQLEQAQVNFSKQWPSYQAGDVRINIDNGAVYAYSKAGRFAGNAVEQLLVTKSIADDDVFIKGHLSGKLADFSSQMSQHQAYQLLNNQLQSLVARGEHRSQLQLRISAADRPEPVKRSSKEDIGFHLKLDTELTNSQLVLPSYSLALNKINGKLAFDSAQGLQAKAIRLSVFDNPAQIDINSQTIEDTLKTSLSLTGVAQTDIISTWIATDQLSKLTGKAAFNARLDICPTNSSCNQLVINSDLVGVGVLLPAPWGKTAEQPAKLQVVSSQSADGSAAWRYNYKDIVRGVTRVKASAASIEKAANDEQLKNAPGKFATHIVFGGERPSEPLGEGVSLSGQLINLDLDQLLISGGTPDQNSELTYATQTLNSLLEGVYRIDFALQNVNLLGRHIPAGWFNLRPTSDQWLMNFDLGFAAGKAQIPLDSKQAISVNLDQLTFQTQPRATQKNLQPAQNKRIDTRGWPKVSLAIKKVMFNTLDIGSWSARLSPTKVGYRMANVQGNIDKTQVNAGLSWENRLTDVRSYIDLTLKGGDFGKLLKRIGQGGVLESQSGLIKAQLNWPGDPWDFEQGRLNGNLSFSMSNGRIIEAGSSASFLRIFGILNLNSIAKRLKLDFSDLVESGLAFDKVTAEYLLESGVATNKAPLKLQGDGAAIEMTGSINLAQKTLIKKMQVAIPLTSNAPVAALLLATPQVAGIAFVVDKLLGKRLAKLTALRYDISGSWFDPKIKPVVYQSKATASHKGED